MNLNSKSISSSQNTSFATSSGPAFFHMKSENSPNYEILFYSVWWYSITHVTCHTKRTDTSKFSGVPFKKIDYNAFECIFFSIDNVRIVA